MYKYGTANLNYNDDIKEKN